MFSAFFTENKSMKPIFGTALLAFFSMLLFGGGVFLHGVSPARPAEAAPAKSVSQPHHGKRKPTPKAEAPKSTIPSVGTENALAFPLMTTGGIGLLLSALAGLGLSRSAAPAARRRLDAALAERRKQQEEFEARNAVLQVQLQEAKARKAETEVQREQVSRQFQEFFRTLPVPCFCFAASGKIIRWNAACETLYGIPAASVLERTLWDTIIPGAEREETEAKIQRVLAGESLHDTERWDTIAGGETARLRCSMVPLYDAESRIIGGLSAGVEVPEIARYEQQIAALNDEREARAQPAEAAGKAAIREQIEQLGQAELSSQMLEKIVTAAAQASSSEAPRPPELFGHPAFRARLAEEIERAARYHGPLSLIVLDLDGFTARNRQFGFEAGDQALQSAVAVIKSKLRSVDVIARLGADDYALILPETGEAGARVAAERMQAGLRGISTTETGGQPPQTACFGVVQLSPDVPDASELIERAQSALAAAQLCGAGTVAHYQDLPQHNLPQTALETAVH